MTKDTVDISPAIIAVYQLLKSVATPMAEGEILAEFSKRGISLSEWEFRANVRRLIEAGAVQKLEGHYLIRDTGGLFCRRIEEIAFARRAQS